MTRPDFSGEGGLYRETRAMAVLAATRLVQILARSRRTLVLAESCTAGLVSELVARTGGASAVLWGAFVCYTPEAKKLMLGLDGGVLARHGPAGMETAREMAVLALRKSGAGLSASVVGVAGPLGDGSPLPVGTVRIAVALRSPAGETVFSEKELLFTGNRAEVRMQAAASALGELLKAAGEAAPRN